MDVILLERVAKLGQMGDVVKVKPGFAHNYLLPQKKALRATEANKARFTQVANFPGPPPLHTDLTQDAPGWYGEFGVHMFFAARYSVILSALYHSIVVREMDNTVDGTPAYSYKGKPFSLDMSGIGARLGVTVGL